MADHAPHTCGAKRAFFEQSLFKKNAVSRRRYFVSYSSGGRLGWRNQVMAGFAPSEPQFPPRIFSR